MALTLVFGQYTRIFPEANMQFKQKVIIITGASGGIGEACALKFAKAGGLLSLIGRNIDNLKQVARKCAEFSGEEPLTVKGDISLPEDIEKIVHDTVKHYGKIDVLVNNAGIMLVGGISDDIANLDKMIAINIRGTYLLTKKCIPHLIETKGNIVTISSIVTSLTEPILTPYTMTKAALDALTRCIASELGPKGVRVNSVNPGPTYTNLFTAGGLTDNDIKKKYEDMAQVSPLKKITESDDVADLVTFLASDKAKSITGSFHSIDGGIHLGVPALHG